MSRMNQYVFVLGREKEICEAELFAVLKRFCFEYDKISLTDSLLYINFLNDYPVGSIVNLLGGTIKAYKVMDSFEPSRIEHSLFDLAGAEISKRSHLLQKTIDFGLSFYFSGYNTVKINQFGFKIKQRLKKKGVATRFLALKSDQVIPNAVTASAKLLDKGIEFGVFRFDETCFVGMLKGFSDLNDWSKRDYSKPAGDKYSGMLPPKLARMMINLAIGQEPGVQSRVSGARCQEPGVKDDLQNLRQTFCPQLIAPNPQLQAPSSLLLDPFCGSGNILLEGLLTGFDVMGCDISDRSVSDSKRNIDWLKIEYPQVENKSPVTQCDATTADFTKIIESAVDKGKIKNLIVVSEPFLGKPKKLKASYKDIDEYEEVRNIYLSFLQNTVALKPYSPIFCLVFPLVETIDGSRYSLINSSVDEIRKMGYTLIRTPLTYGREYQIVKREIVLLALDN